MATSTDGVATSRSRVIEINRCILCQDKKSPVVRNGISALGSFETGGSETGAEAGECGPRDVKRWGSFILTQLYNLTDEEFQQMWGDDGGVEGRILSLEICKPCVQLVREFRTCHEEMQEIQRKMDSMRLVARGKLLGSPLETGNATAQTLSSAAQEEQVREYFRNVVDIVGQPSAVTSHQKINIKDEPPSGEDLEVDLSPASSQAHFGGERESLNIAEIGAEETEPCPVTRKQLRKSKKRVKCSSTSNGGSNPMPSQWKVPFVGATFSNPNSHTLDPVIRGEADSPRRNNNVVLDNNAATRGNVGSVARKVHACTTCGKSFKRKGNCNRHNRDVHAREKAFLCVMCSRKFARYGALEAHMRTHTKERPFACNKCGKEFAQHDHLRRHILTHTQSKSYYCIFCEKGFLRQMDLTSHIRMHTREKVFLCKLCQTEFLQSGGLTRHIRVHKNERAWVCQFCSKTFVTYDELDSHMRVHTQEKPFLCKTCGQEFSQSTTLKRHIKRMNHLY